MIRVGRNVSFDQAIDILARAGRNPDHQYARELLKVVQAIDNFIHRKTIEQKVEII